MREATCGQKAACRTWDVNSELKGGAGVEGIPKSVDFRTREDVYYYVIINYIVSS